MSIWQGKCHIKTGVIERKLKLANREPLLWESNVNILKTDVMDVNLCRFFINPQRLITKSFVL